MKALFTGDWHLDWTTGGLERFDEISGALDQTIDHAAIEKVDAYFFLGDLCDPDVDEALAHRAIARSVEAAEELKRRGIPSFWITGNHDVIEDGRGSHTLMALSKAGHQVIDRPRTISVNGVTVCFLSYTARSHRYDPAEHVRSARFASNDRILIVGHMTEIDGFGFGSETHEMPRGRAMRFPLEVVAELQKTRKVTCVNGHFHDRHLDGPVFTPGTLARLTHGEEANEPGFLILEV
jgi:DNA repair exonuclease SbcCD nuclease subunit